MLQDPRRFFEATALLESVESGAIAPLRGRWLVAMHARGERLKRRQELPSEALFSAAELRHLLPVKQLKGTEPVETLDLSNKSLGFVSGIAIAKLIEGNAVLTDLNLSHNQLCGINYFTGEGTYDASGIQALASIGHFGQCGADQPLRRK